MKRLFVYGTLLEGQPGHNRILPGKTPLEHTWTRERAYMMVTARSKDFPYVFRGGNCRVKGEVYALTCSEMTELDVYEDYPRLYGRQVVLLESGEPAEMYTPLDPTWILEELERGEMVLVPEGDWVSFISQNTDSLSI